MTIDSTAPGYLRPSVDATQADDAMNDVLQRMVVGITGLPGAMVRPRFQRNPPDMPENEVDWCAIGAMDIEPPEGLPDRVHNPAGDGGAGTTTLSGIEVVNVLASFYGPNAMRYGTTLRDGLTLAQNQDELAVDGSFGLIWFGPLRLASGIQNTDFRARYDIAIRLRHRFERTYGVRNITEISGKIVTDGGLVGNDLERSFSVKTKG